MQLIIISLLSLLSLYLLVGVLLTFSPTPVRKMLRWEQFKDRTMERKVPAIVYHITGVLFYPSMLHEHYEKRRASKEAIAQRSISTTYGHPRQSCLAGRCPHR